jgi:hypothetical protein
MIVTFGKQTLTGAAQPLFTDTLTASLAVPPHDVDPILTVADTTKYQVGFRISIDPGQSDVDLVKVVAILSPTTMRCSYEGATGHPHAVNTVIGLAIAAAEITIQPSSGDANSVFLGTDNTVTNVGGGKTFYEVIPGQPYRMTNSGQYNTVNTADAWMAGTSAQTVIVSALVI